MEKYKGQLWVRDARESQSNAGASRRFRLPPELVRMLGQGDRVYFHGRVYSRDPNAQVKFSVWTGCLGKELPADSGINVKVDTPTLTNQADVTVNTVGTFLLWTAGDLMADVEIVADVSDATATALVRIEFELWCTVVAP